jgi:ABC-2 type transport system ATP-binding protein
MPDARLPQADRAGSAQPADPAGADVTIDVRGLRMRYGSVDVLQGVDFTARRGEVIALLGPNGAGKTTTIEILEGFRTRSAGEVAVLGVDPDRGDDRWRARLGVVLQSWRDHGGWRVRELLHHLGRYYERYATPQRRRPFDADELIETVGLTPHATKKIAVLSGGQRRRLDVAIGIIGRPEVLFLDEPTVGFDPAVRRDFHDLVLRLSDLEDTTVLLTTHDLYEADKLADRILILAGGRIVAEGTSAELARRVSGRQEVRWSHDGEHFTQTTDDATEFVWQLFHRHGRAVGDLEVRRPSLEDIYLAMVQHYETDAALPVEEGHRWIPPSTPSGSGSNADGGSSATP